MLEKYKKLKILGQGATAQVFLVEEIATGELFAMKVGGQGALLRWEADLLGSLYGKYFPKVKEYFKETREYLVMEYISGVSLQELLDKGTIFKQEEILHIMEGILYALDKLHRHEPAIIYRDLKPSNVMVKENGEIRLIDMGAACLADGTFGSAGDGNAGTMQVGTYGYAAPEQFWKGFITGRSCDIYAAGKILAYLLSGKNPAEPPYDVEQFCKGLKKVPPTLIEIIERCLALQPQARYEDCEDLRRDIYMVFQEKTNKKMWKKLRKRTCCYKKCIWKSEYRRIF